MGLAYVFKEKKEFEFLLQKKWFALKYEPGTKCSLSGFSSRLSLALNCFLLAYLDKPQTKEMSLASRESYLQKGKRNLAN